MANIENILAFYIKCKIVVKILKLVYKIRDC